MKGTRRGKKREGHTSGEKNEWKDTRGARTGEEHTLGVEREEKALGVWGRTCIGRGRKWE